MATLTYLRMLKSEQCKQPYGAIEEGGRPPRHGIFGAERRGSGEELKEGEEEDRGLLLTPKTGSLPTLRERLSMFFTRERIVAMIFGTVLFIFVVAIIARIVSVEEHKKEARHKNGGQIQ